jgi:hypothetical protein
VHAVALNEDVVVEYGQSLSFVTTGILRESGAKDSFGVLPQQAAQRILLLLIWIMYQKLIWRF